jgi:hypothetical protein
MKHKSEIMEEIELFVKSQKREKRLNFLLELLFCSGVAWVGYEFFMRLAQ